LLVTLAAVFNVRNTSFAADAPEHWVAASTTAMSVTGNVTFEPKKITFQNGQSLPLSFIGPAPRFKDMDETVSAVIYRVTTPSDPALKSGNRLCGGGKRMIPVTYIAVWKPKPVFGDQPGRSMAAFSGEDAPRSSAGNGSCGVYNYELGH
jgi:hypothetical protein